MHTFMQNYFLAYDVTKDDISSHILRFILDIFSVLPFQCLKCHSEALEKTYLTTSENFQERLLAIFHTKYMGNFTNSGLFQQQILLSNK